MGVVLVVTSSKVVCWGVVGIGLGIWDTVGLVRVSVSVVCWFTSFFLPGLGTAVRKSVMREKVNLSVEVRLLPIDVSGVVGLGSRCFAGNLFLTSFTMGDCPSSPS